VVYERSLGAKKGREAGGSKRKINIYNKEQKEKTKSINLILP
jgi:hypothetical protein